MAELTQQEIAFNKWWSENLEDLREQGVYKTQSRIAWNASWKIGRAAALKDAADYVIQSDTTRANMAAVIRSL
jgi:hypothetical protein